MTGKRKVAGSNLVTDDFSTCNPTCDCGLCGYLVRNPGEGVKLGSNPRKAGENHSLNWGVIPERQMKIIPSLTV
jgi:hypothetical protein